MGEEMRMWSEVLFNVAYLLIVWGFVIAMIREQPDVPEADQPITRLFILAFGLLALGDTGHVGFRVVAYAQGNLETTVNVIGNNIGLVGLGALSTAITVTLFYLILLMIWQKRFDKPYGWFGFLLITMGVMRFILMIPLENQWNSTIPPQSWSLYRNLPLTIIGLGVAFLMLRDSLRAHDRTFTWIGAFIIVSYAFYLPVILFVQEVPPIGMLMIPKTLAYLGIAILAYRDLFRGLNRSPQTVR